MPEIQWEQGRNYDRRGPPPSVMHGYLTQLGGIITLNSVRYHRGRDEVDDAQRLIKRKQKRRQRQQTRSERQSQHDKGKRSEREGKQSRPWMHPVYRCHPPYYGLQYRILGFLTRRRSLTEEGLSMAEEAARERNYERRRRQNRLAQEALAIRMGAHTVHRPRRHSPRRDSRRDYAPLHNNYPNKYSNRHRYHTNERYQHHTGGRHHVTDPRRHRASSRSYVPVVPSVLSDNYAPRVPPKTGYVPYHSVPDRVGHVRSSRSTPRGRIDGLPPDPYYFPPNLERPGFIPSPPSPGSAYETRSSIGRYERYNGSPYPPQGMRAGTHSTRTSRRSGSSTGPGIVPVEPSVGSHRTYGSSNATGNRYSSSNGGGQAYVNAVPVMKSTSSSRRTYR